MKRLLLVSYYFPPLGGVGTLRVLSFARHLGDLGWDVTVVAPRRGGFAEDPSLEFPEERVIRTGSLELSRVGKSVVPGAGGGGGDEPSGLVSRLRSFAHRWLYSPDAQIGWYPFAVRAASRALRAQRFDAVLTSSFPITAHLVGLRLHERFGVPWVADYRDTWVDWVPENHPKRDDWARTEGRLLRAATVVTTVSPDWARTLRERGADHVRVVFNGYEEGHLLPPAPPPEPVLTHLGSYYPEFQDLGAVWRALAERESTATVRLIGAVHPRLSEDLRRAGLADAVEETGLVPHPEVARHLASSTALLIGGPRDTREKLKGWIPAKVFEYLGAGLPIVYVGDLETDVARLLRSQPKCYLAATGDVDAARNALESAMAAGVVERETSHFTRRAQVAELAKALEAATA